MKYHLPTIAAMCRLLSPLALTGCQTNPATGARELTPESLAAMNRIGQRVIIAGEQIVEAKLDKILRVDPAK